MAPSSSRVRAERKSFRRSNGLKRNKRTNNLPAEPETDAPFQPSENELFKKRHLSPEQSNGIQKRRKVSGIQDLNGNEIELILSGPLGITEAEQCSFNETESTERTDSAQGLHAESIRSNDDGIGPVENRAQNHPNINENCTVQVRNEMRSVQVLNLSNRRQSRSRGISTLRATAFSPTTNSTIGNDVSPNADGNNLSQEDVLSTDISTKINNLKVDLLEAQRDKRVYSSHIASLQEKCENQQKELQMKTQQLAALEVALSNRKTRSDSKKGHVWSAENLGKLDLGCCQGIILTSARHATKSKLIVTESYIVVGSDGDRKRDWTGSAREIIAENADLASIYVKFPNGLRGIPTVSMVRAQEKEFYTSRVNGAKGLLEICLSTVLKGPVGDYMDDEEKEDCTNKIMAHGKTIQRFRAVLSDATGNRKKAAKTTFLRSL